MKVLGRRSLASVLKVGVDVAFYAAVVVSVLLAVLLFLAGVTEDGATTVGLPVSFALDASVYDVASREGGDVEAEIVDARGTLNVARSGDSRVLMRTLLVFPVFGVVILVLARLRRLFGRLREGRPFDARNAADLRYPGFAVLALELLWAVTSYWMTARLPQSSRRQDSPWSRS